jgi:hypothetical protein
MAPTVTTNEAMGSHGTHFWELMKLLGSHGTHFQELMKSWDSHGSLLLLSWQLVTAIHDEEVECDLN